MPVPLLLDMDIGTDVDDLFALAFALASPELDIIGVTTVYGEVEKRADVALEMLRACGRSDVPVAVGEADPLTPGAGSTEGRDADLHKLDMTRDRDGHGPQIPGVSFLLQMLAEHPGASVAATGPLTNLGLLARRFPAAFASIGLLSIMGGNYCGVGARSIRPEHNFASDPDAASEVLSRPASAQLVGLNVTRQTCLDRQHLEEMRAIGTPVADLLAKAGAHYLEKMGRERTPMHDALAVAALVDPSICRWETLEPYVQTVGREAGVVTFEKPSGGGVRVRVATSVDAVRFQRLFAQRIHGLLRKS